MYFLLFGEDRRKNKKENRKWPAAAKGEAKKAVFGTADKNTSGKDNGHNRDISSRGIFKNSVLCAQFLRDKVDIPILKNVQQEDIEDVSERYPPTWERNSRRTV